MKEQATSAIRDFVSAFGELHRMSSRVSYNTLNAVYITCYSMMSSEERRKSLSSLIGVLKGIGDEKFEDGPDFISFLKEKIEEQFSENQND